MSKRPLEYAATADLLDELMERHEHAIFIGLNCGVRVDGAEDGEAILRRWSGNSVTVMGLCVEGSAKVLEHFNAGSLGDVDEDGVIQDE